MGRPKALLPYGASTFSRLLIQTFHRAGFSRPTVVVGHDPGPLVAHLCDLGVRFVCNRRWPLGQMSSLQAAIRSCPPGTDGILVALADQPGLRPSTIRRVIAAHRKNPRDILIASVRGRSGHPVFFPKGFFRDLLAAPIQHGARWVIQKNPAARRVVATSDPAVVRDIDTPAEFRKLK